jgi:hypothetical protein
LRLLLGLVQHVYHYNQQQQQHVGRSNALPHTWPKSHQPAHDHDAWQQQQQQDYPVAAQAAAAAALGAAAAVHDDLSAALDAARWQ